MGAIEIEEIDADRFSTAETKQSLCNLLRHLGETVAGGNRLRNEEKAFEGQMKPEVIDG